RQPGELDSARLMQQARIASACECQARLEAFLDEKRYVLAGSASLSGLTERSPAHAIGAERRRFDVAWLCPFCGRNTLRSFDSEASGGGVAPVPARAVTPPPAPPKPPGPGPDTKLPLNGGPMPTAASASTAPAQGSAGSSRPPMATGSW